MRHQVAGKHLGRTSAHRKALRRNLAASLFEHGTISTTPEKAKFVRPFAEKLITLAKDGSLHARRRAIKLLQNRRICRVEKGEPVEAGTVVKKLFDEIGPGFAGRNGGYTRMIRLPWRRIGDNGKLVLLQLVGAEESVAASGPATKRVSSAAVPSTEDEAVDQQEEPQEVVEQGASEEPADDDSQDAEEDEAKAPGGEPDEAEEDKA